MFGESDSESPRAGSPWDSIITNTPPPRPGSNVETIKVHSAYHDVPKLAPEVEHGNVEYKLKLLNPTPERFTRLVTQLKWRLLEGGGEAYYELGVGDSGHLVGLSRADLEASLETLEMMAGDIGASVVVVKEVELPRNPPNGYNIDSALQIPISRPAIISRNTEILSGNQQSATADTEVENSSVEGGNDDRIYPPHPYNGVDASHSPETPLVTKPRTFPNHTASESFGPLTKYDIEISTVYKPRPQRSGPRTFVPTKRDIVETNRVKIGNGKWVKFKLQGVQNNGGNKNRLPSCPVTTQVELGTPSVEDIVPQFNTLALDDTRVLTSDSVMLGTAEPRFIVEALVVRKLALEEAFLDFSGFALN